MNSDVDYYDVQAMIRDARPEIRGEIADAVRAVRDELRDELEGLRDELRETHRYFQHECDSIMRVLNPRTEHLA